MKSDPKIEIAGMQMNFSMPQFIFFSWQARCHVRNL